MKRTKDFTSSEADKMSALEKVIELSHTLPENTDRMQEKFIQDAAIRMRGTKNRTHPFLCRKAGKTESIVSVQDGNG